jgi:hypothetical protein
MYFDGTKIDLVSLKCVKSNPIGYALHVMCVLFAKEGDLVNTLDPLHKQMNSHGSRQLKLSVLQIICVDLTSSCLDGLEAKFAFTDEQITSAQRINLNVKNGSQ